MVKRLALLAFTLSLLAGGSAMVSAKDEDAAGMTKQQADSLISSKLTSVKAKSEIPKEFWDAMSLGSMADIGGNFDAGCTGQGPHTRLVAVALSKNAVCAIVEQGGIAYFKTFYIYKKQDDGVKCVYHEMVNDQKRCDEVKKKLAG